jgi:hypothetical protein
MRTYIKVPIKIITPKIPGKQDSVFYAGKNIAEVKVRDRTYVLTTAGEYTFSLEENGDTISFDSDRMIGGGAPGRTRNNTLSRLTGKKIKTLNDNGLIINWGWFGINVWEQQPYITQTQPRNFSITPKDQCLPTPTDVYSSYDEAMNAFIEYIEKDLK